MVAQQQNRLRIHNRPAAAIPPSTLTMSQIRAVVPPHCFERSLLTSLKHLAIDLTLTASLAITIHLLHTLLPPTLPFRAALYLLAWPMYWWWQGAVMTGVWVLAHECGHQSFSPYTAVNDAVGIVLHSALLVPYHSWRITHAQHHKQTNHTTGDQVFVPSSRHQYNRTHSITVAPDGSPRYASPLKQALEETPLGDLVGILRMLTFGWWAYLSFNISGQSYGPNTNHFNPRAPMFSRKQFWHIVASDVGIAAAFCTIFAAIRSFGLASFVAYYFIPYMFVNMWLVLITFLQHSDPAIPHYTPKAFSFIRGALGTVDRDFGLYNVLHHHIGDTHVAHHLFSQMPFYHAQEATEAVKKVLGPYYYKDDSSIIQAVRRSWAYCKFVDHDDGDILFYHNYKTEALPDEKVQ